MARAARSLRGSVKLGSIAMITAVQGKKTSGLADNSRSKAPVFVVGVPRSGTTVLYHMLLSAGGFAVYRAESHAFNLLARRFGDLKFERSRKRLADAWLRSKLFRVSGLDAQAVRSELLSKGRSAGEVLRLIMEGIARQQGVERWADTTPEHLLYMREIKRQIPNALFLHIIRDGRDVALSYAQQGWSHPLPWDRGEEVPVAALYWDWMVRRGRYLGERLGDDYLEIRFEELVASPHGPLKAIAGFIAHDLDYDRIQSAGIGSVSRPNTSFGSDERGQFNPVDRWKSQMPEKQLAAVESLTGALLQQLGYSLANPAAERATFRTAFMRMLYPKLFSAKLWLRNHTLLGRFSDTSVMELEGG